MKRVAARETENEAARGNYTYRQTVTVEEFDNRGASRGSYQEVRDVIFSPAKERTEQMVGKPRNGLVMLKMTDEDFRDIREIQPMLLTKEMLWLYRAKPRGEETMDGIDCWVLSVEPKQILDGQRLFEGMLWIDKRDYSIVRSQGKAVPEHRSTKSENLFPRFTTVREKIDGFWFPMYTHADDVLEFKTGGLRMKMRIQYQNYKRFGADTTIKYEDPK